MGSESTGKGVIINNTVPLPNGFVLDSATNFKVWTNSYGFVYNEKGKLLSDSNLASRAVLVQDFQRSVDFQVSASPQQILLQ